MKTRWLDADYLEVARACPMHRAINSASACLCKPGKHNWSVHLNSRALNNAQAWF